MKNNIIITGYGKMGKEVEKVAMAREDMAVLGIIDPAYPSIISNKNGIDILNDFRNINIEKAKEANITFIDFTEPKTAVENIAFYCANGLNAVVGTTGTWRTDAGTFAYAKKMVDEAGITLVHASNFSPIVHATMIANRLLSAMLNDIKDFDAGIVEGHHPFKKDASGTGKTMAQDIIRGGYFGKSELLTALVEGNPVEPHQIMMAVNRIAGVFGEHEIRYTNASRDGNVRGDTVKLSHEAAGRGGFAKGSVDAVEWIADNPNTKGFIDYADIIKDRFVPLIEKELAR
ncbi:MAG: hypothetical protein FWD15_02355 [Alphaproteobacteria bacterium]|nr:hypothetical protein [Alphaproteobacteria bacterium]